MNQRNGNRSLLRCGVLIDGSGAPAQEDAAVLVEDGKIAAIEPWHEQRFYEQNALETHDFSTQTVLAGLIDAHVHLCLKTEVESSALAEAGDPVEIVAWGLASAIAALRSGVTTVVDVGSPLGLASRVASLIDQGYAVGPKVFAAGLVITTTAGHGAEFGRLADSGAELVRAVRSAVADGADLIKIMVTGGAIDPSTNRRRSQYSEEELRLAIDDAHRLGRRVVGHANATEGIARAVRAGIDIVAHCNWLASEPGKIEIDYETVAQMVRLGTWIDLNIEGATRDLAATDGVVQSWPVEVPEPANRWELLAPLRGEGVPLYLTSDAFGPAVGSFTETLCQARATWQLDVEELISLASGEPARALGMEAVRGLLAPGRVADFVVVEGDLRSHPDALLNPIAVFRNGEEAVAHGRLQPPDAAVGVGSAAAAQRSLLESVFEVLS